jgi:hypothetical protein
MKRRDLLAKISQIAKAKGVKVELTEGGSHTKVTVGNRQTTIPRHSEINEMTARGILKYLEGK